MGVEFSLTVEGIEQYRKQDHSPIETARTIVTACTSWWCLVGSRPLTTVQSPDHSLAIGSAQSHWLIVASQRV